MTHRTPTSPLHQSASHESAALHVTGEALYVDDLPRPRGLLVGLVVTSPVARGRITRLDVTAARLTPNVACVLTANDIPGINDISPFSHDEPLLATDEVHCVGQAIAVIFGDTAEACREAARAVVLELQALPPILSIQEAIAAQSFIGAPHVMQRQDVQAVLDAAPVRITGTVDTGGQDHFYLESHCAMAVPDERGTLMVYSSTQHPAEVQAKCAEVLGIARSRVVVESRRMGGGFGGKETQGAYFAAYAALGTHHTGRPCKVWLNRDQDMTQTGKRHPFHSTYDAGFDREGNLLGLDVHIFSDGGWSADLSAAILDRALFHIDNAYYIPALRFEGRICRTNTVSNTAFRGFGGPQGMFVVEEVLNRAAERLLIDPAMIRARNYYGQAPRNLTPYFQEVKAADNRLERLHTELLELSDYRGRRQAIDRFNAEHRHTRRGIALQPLKFGISFTASHLNQAGAFVNIYADGTVQLNHGGTEMGQGLHTKMLAICAHELGVRLDQIRQMPTATDKVPNTSATAASSGSDLNGMAVQQACVTLRERLRPVAAELLDLSDGAGLLFADGRITHPRAPDDVLDFSAVAMAAYMKQISMSATGFYQTPDIGYNHATGRGKPFHYYAYGAAVTELEVNGLTGEHRLLRIDVLHDAGHSLIPSIDIGQIEGAYIQGFGWLTCEELLWSPQGHLRTHSPDTYKIPAYGECPEAFHVHLLDRAAQPDVIHGSKAVGEPPFMLAIGAVTALRHAIAAFAQPGFEVQLSIPATPESVLRAVEHARAHAAGPLVLPPSHDLRPGGAETMLA